MLHLYECIRLNELRYMTDKRNTAEETYSLNTHAGACLDLNDPVWFRFEGLYFIVPVHT